MPERLIGSRSGGPREQGPPLGHLQHTICKRRSTRSRRLRPRVCLRLDCGRVYRPRCWNQRYCQDPECLKLVCRWQALKRQQQRRSRPEAREAHAAAERDRRARRRREGSCPASSTRTDSEGHREPDHWGESSRRRTDCPEKDRRARCDHRKAYCPAPPTRIDPRKQDPDASGLAWSRSKKTPASFCNRPGCYRAVRCSHRCHARYCSDECRQAMKRVHDRERKWLARNTEAGRFKRRLEYEAARRVRRATHSQVETQASSPRVTGRQPVVNSRFLPPGSVPCGDPREGPADDREKNPGRRPRAPPSA